ncbi:hypothetical protein CCH79_00012738 [Gambusia affinis]|uniref:Uncharacterized protein n=1 Tax=Gambusia affinis TaxID=33528 RepID=A0A315V0E5_GAMAF|nr:hypothetical protein CCH79_00012738 [Gambusia affinis]
MTTNKLAILHRAPVKGTHRHDFPIAGPEDRLRIDHHYTFKVCISCILFDKETRCMYCVFTILNMSRLSRPVKVDRERILTHSRIAENFSFLPPGGSCESCVQPKPGVVPSSAGRLRTPRPPARPPPLIGPSRRPSWGHRERHELACKPALAASQCRTRSGKEQVPMHKSRQPWAEMKADSDWL